MGIGKSRDDIIIVKTLKESCIASVYEGKTKDNIPVIVKTGITEYNVYNALKSKELYYLFPKLYDSKSHDNYSVVIEKLTGTLKDKIIDLDSLFRINTRIITALQILHSTNYLHCDLAPDNIGYRDEITNVVLFDFGHASYIWPPCVYSSIPNRTTYSSLNMHYSLPLEQELKALKKRPYDDIESWFYVQITLLGIDLPWNGLAEEVSKLNDELNKIETELEDNSKEYHQTTTKLFEQREIIENLMKDIDARAGKMKLELLKNPTVIDNPYLQKYAELCYTYILNPDKVLNYQEFTQITV